MATLAFAVLATSCGSDGPAGGRADGGAAPGGGTGGDRGAPGGGSGAGLGGTTAGGGEKPPVCSPGQASKDSAEPGYGFATAPPTMALSDTFYVYDVRTNIGACSTEQVEWRFDVGPVGSALEIAGISPKVGPVGSYTLTSGGQGRVAAKLAWSLAGVAPGCYDFVIRWRAWLDCGIGDPGKWGNEVVQSFSVAVRVNHWWSGDLHVHTRHSERGPEAGGVWDYYARMLNLTKNDAGQDFADRRRRSLRGRLHWLVFSDHTNNEKEECGRHFSAWCAAGENVNSATGRDVARQLTEHVGDTLLVVGSEISNALGGHFGFLPKNPFPGHPLYAPGYTADATSYDFDVGYGTGVFPERWVKSDQTNAAQLALMKQLGALRIVNHESALIPWISYDWSSLDLDGIEVWNGGNRHDSYDDGAYHGGIDVNAVAAGDLLETRMPEDPIERSWLGLLKTGKWPVALVGGSDVHDSNEVVCYQGPCDPTNAELALPTTTVWANSFLWTNGQDGIFDGIARGRAVVHDYSNFIDLRVVHAGLEYHVGDTISGYVPGTPLGVRAFGHVADYVDGHNRTLLVMSANADPNDRRVRVLYNSGDTAHFVTPLKGKQHMRVLFPDSSFDRSVETSLSAEDLGASGTAFVLSQLIPFHNPLYLLGNGQDMALTGAIRVRVQP